MIIQIYAFKHRGSRALQKDPARKKINNRPVLNIRVIRRHGVGQIDEIRQHELARRFKPVWCTWRHILSDDALPRHINAWEHVHTLCEHVHTCMI